MYFGVYYHRTVRAIELQIREIFSDSIKLLYGERGKLVNPYSDLNTFFTMDDWSFLCGVQNLSTKQTKRAQKIATKWTLILERKPKWRCIDQIPEDVVLT